MCCQGIGGNCLVSYIWFSTACETWFRDLFLFYFCVLLVVSCLGLFSRVLLVLAKVRLHACVGYLYEALTNIVLLGRTLLNMKAAALEKKREKRVKKGGSSTSILHATKPQFFQSRHRGLHLRRITCGQCHNGPTPCYEHHGLQLLLKHVRSTMLQCSNSLLWAPHRSLIVKP